MKQFNIIMIYTISHNSRIIKLLKKNIYYFDVQTKKGPIQSYLQCFPLHFFLLTIVEHVVSGGINNGVDYILLSCFKKDYRTKHRTPSWLTLPNIPFWYSIYFCTKYTILIITKCHADHFRQDSVTVFCVYHTGIAIIKKKMVCVVDVAQCRGSRHKTLEFSEVHFSPRWHTAHPASSLEMFYF